MFATAEQIQGQLLAGEDSRAEFKELRLTSRGVRAPNAEAVAGEMVAFANADGGTLFLGVNDAGTPLGIPQERLDVVERWLVNIATQNCDPPIRPIVRKHVMRNGDACKHLILAEIPRGLYVHRATGGRYYQRVGSTKRDLTPPELVRLFQQRGREYIFDERAVLVASVSALNQHRLEAFFGRSPTIPWLDLLRNTRVTTPDEQGEDRPTVAGLLAFATEPADFLPSCSIEAACYAGTALSSDQLTHVERLAGPASDRHALPHLHPQPALGELPLPPAQQAHRGSVLGIPWRGCAEDPAAGGSALRAEAGISVVRGRAAVDVMAWRLMVVRLPSRHDLRSVSCNAMWSRCLLLTMRRRQIS